MVRSQRFLRNIDPSISIVKVFFFFHQSCLFIYLFFIYVSLRYYEPSMLSLAHIFFLSTHSFFSLCLGAFFAQIFIVPCWSIFTRLCWNFLHLTSIANCLIRLEHQIKGHSIDLVQGLNSVINLIRSPRFFRHFDSHPPGMIVLVAQCCSSYYDVKSSYQVSHFHH